MDWERHRHPCKDMQCLIYYRKCKCATTCDDQVWLPSERIDWAIVGNKRDCLYSCSTNQGSCNPVVLIRAGSSWRTITASLRSVQNISIAQLYAEQESSAGGNNVTLGQGLSNMYL